MAPANNKKWRIKPGDMEDTRHLWAVITPLGKIIAYRRSCESAMNFLCKKILRHPAASLLQHSFSPPLDAYHFAVKKAP